MRDTERAFLALVKTGLFPIHGEGGMINDSFHEDVDWGEVYRIAEEQSVIGLVAAGIDRFKVNDSRFTISQAVALQLIGQTLQIEQRNKAMNAFVAELIDKMRSEGIYTLLVKGQGVAECYEKPLWRTCGDIDLFLSEDNYKNAKELLSHMGEMTEPEEGNKRHFALKIDQWAVELHGTLRGGLSNRVDGVLDEVQKDVFFGGNVRSWQNGKTQVFLPGVDCDVVYVFAHILQHFYKGGIGLRQICDWCRLLWTYRETLNHEYLESKIKEAGLMTEWKAFGAFAVESLGMPLDAMPFYSAEQRWKKKAVKICSFILEVGNFGHNRDNSYFQKHSYFVQKCISAWRRVKDLARHARIFPVNSFRFFFGIMFNGVRSAVRGE